MLPYSSLAVTGDAFHYYRAKLIDEIDSKGHKMELKSRKYSINHTKSKLRHKLFMDLGVYMHAHTLTHNTHTPTFAHQSNFKKPRACRLQASDPLI